MEAPSSRRVHSTSSFNVDSAHFGFMEKEARGGMGRLDDTCKRNAAAVRFSTRFRSTNNQPDPFRMSEIDRCLGSREEKGQGSDGQTYAGD